MKWFNMSFYYFKHCLMLGIILFCFNKGYCQNYIDIFRLDYSSNNAIQYKLGGGKSNLREFLADLAIPIKISTKANLIGGLVVENIDVSPFAFQNEISVYTVGLKIGINRTYNEKWSATYMLLPKASSELNSINTRDFQIGCAVLAKCSINKNFNYKIGIFYNSDLFGAFVTPLLGVYFQKNKYEVNLLLPRMGDVNYSINPNLKLGLRFNGTIRSFNINDQHGNSQYLQIANSDIGPYIGYSYRRLNIQAMVSQSFGRYYRVYNSDDKIDLSLSVFRFGDNRQQLNTDLKDGVIYKISAFYRIGF